MTILEKLWYGDVCPNEQSSQQDSVYCQKMREAERELKELENGLSPEQCEAVERLLDMQLGASSVAEKDAFIKGFCMGAQILMAVMTEK